MRFLTFLLFALLLSPALNAQESPLRIGVVGLTHTHVHWILGREDLGDIEIVGIAEPNRDLAKRYAEQHGFSMDLIYDSMEEMIASSKPEAVTAFGTIYDHLEVVQFCAPKGIHVMVEKPLAVSLDHAEKMQQLAEEYDIQLLTNYETSWYPTTHKTYELVRSNEVGSLRKVVVRDGHKGPKKIGINKEFLDWLTDPELNGAGALMDFGCYGVNLMTWLKNGQSPRSVTAVVQQLQKENNPKVDDDATLILTYDDANAVIQASWNWPIGRKDMAVYGLNGVIYADDSNSLRVRISEGYDGYQEEAYELPNLNSPYKDPFSLFASVVRGTFTLTPFDTYSLENNMMVMRVLEAAKESARSGKTVFFD